jgi:hypothetical protein
VSEGATRIVAGIDEAGLGPLLGPLCLGYSVLRFPAGARTLWERLAPLVSDEPARSRASFVVADSKRVFQRNPTGAKRLESVALGFLAQREPGRSLPASAERLLWRTPGELAVAPPERILAEHPWYAAEPGLPWSCHAGLLELDAERLARALRAERIELLDAGVVVVPEGELNRSFDETRSKSATEWRHSARILERLWNAHAGQGLKLVIDRLGGRSRYGALLARALPNARVAGARETPERSEYELVARAGAAGRMRVLFAEKAERGSFPVALASCLAKYARETAMRSFNAYFAARERNLAPTAGYTTDGRRWLEQAAPALAAAGVERAALVRTR